VKAARGAAAFVLAAALAGCGRSGDPVRDTLDRLAAAARARDAAGVAALLTDDYRDGSGGGRDDARRTLAGYFAGYEIVDVKISEVAVERSAGAARARFRADVSGQPKKASGLAGLLPSASAYRFDLRLVPDGSRWKIAWASWEPARARSGE
jgi:hypothetical protein